ncbi:putative [histone H3]-lysine(4) N-trimethyltransferase [Helianthus anomalus]
MEISVGADLETVYKPEVGNKERSSWLGNGEGDETKLKRKELGVTGFDDLTKSKKVRHSIDDDDDTQVDSRSSSGFGQKTNGGGIGADGHAVLIPKRPRGAGGRSKFAKGHLLNPSASLEKLHDQKEVSGSGHSSVPTPVKLNGVKSRKKDKGVVGSKGNKKQGPTAVASGRHAKSGGDLVESLFSKDEVAQLKGEIKFPGAADDAPLSSSSLGSKDDVAKLKKQENPQNKDDQMGKLKGKSKIMEIDGKQKQTEDPAVVGSFLLAKGEGTDVAMTSKRNGGNRMKRKRLGSNGETVSKKVAASSSSVDLDPDNDLEQNAARMLSSRFDPSCTGFASESTTLGLLSVNEGEQEKHTGSQGPMTASAEAQDRVLRPRRHKKGKGTSRKRRHFYEIHSDDMDAHWFLNRKIKIFWPLDESWYYGLVNDYDAEKNLHHIKYEDRDEEWISLESERFKLLLLPSELPRKANSLNYTTPSEESSLVHMKDDGFMESEPIISWLAHHRVKSSTATCLRKQNFSRDVCSMMERETDKLNCTSVLFNTSVEDNIGSEGHVPIVYVRRRRYHRFSDAEAAAPPWPLNNATAVLKLDTTQPLIQRDKFEICIPLWPMLTYSVLGADILWLLRSVFLLQFGTLVTMWPTVFLEVLFVDNIVGLRLFLFEGCLKQAVAFIFLVMNVFCEHDKDESINHQVPVTSIRFKLSFFHNFKNHKVFAYFTFSKVRDFDWQYLDSVFKPHCLLSKHLSLSECTYDNIKLLQGVPQTKHIPYAVQTEVFHKKSNGGGGSLLSSSRSSKRVPGIRTIYSLRHGNVPPFALSFTASPSLFISLHLKLLLERSISLAAADDGDDDEDFSQFEISSESSSSKGSSHDGRGIESSTFVSAGNSQSSRQFNDPHTSNLKGIISVEIPASDEVYRPQQHQMSDLTWNLSDGIICSPNQHSTGPKTSLWHHRRPWGDGKTEIFGIGPKKPRTQVQYTLPYSNKNKGHNNLPYQRIRKTNDKKISDTKSGGPKRNLELVTCDANILINGGDKGWRECGARVFLEADQQKEWKLAVKCSGELRYAYKVHQDLQPGSTNRYTHAMMWKGGKDWALEFPERSQWVVFKELHEECHNRNIRAASIKNIPIPGVRPIQVVDHPHQKEECFTRTPWYLRQVRDDVEMAMDASRVMYDMDSEDEEWVCRSRSKEGSDGHDIISDELFEKVMDMLEKVSYAQKRDHFSSGEIDELIARVTPMQAAKSIYDHWREKRQRKGMPLVRQLQPPLWERYQQICREWEKLKPKSTTGPGSGSQEKASAAAGDKPPMFAFCLKPRGLEVLNKGSKHRPHKKISLSGHSLGDHDAHHSGRRVHTYGFGDERADSSDVSPLLVTKMYSPRDTGHFWLDGGDASDHQLRIQSSKSSIRTLVSPKLGPSAAALRKSSSVKRNNSKKFSDWHHNRVQQQQLVLGGSDLDEFRLRDASSAAKHARNMAKLKRERAQKLMLSADLAIHKAVSALMTAEAIKASCTGGDNESTSPPSSVS